MGIELLESLNLPQYANKISITKIQNEHDCRYKFLHETMSDKKLYHFLILFIVQL